MLTHRKQPRNLTGHILILFYEQFKLIWIIFYHIEELETVIRGTRNNLKLQYETKQTSYWSVARVEK